MRNALRPEDLAAAIISMICMRLRQPTAGFRDRSGNGCASTPRVSLPEQALTSLALPWPVAESLQPHPVGVKDAIALRCRRLSRSDTWKLAGSQPCPAARRLVCFRTMRLHCAVVVWSAATRVDRSAAKPPQPSDTPSVIFANCSSLYSV